MSSLFPVNNYDFFVDNQRKIFVLVDENTRLFCLPHFIEQTKNYPLTIIEMQSGEIHKNMQTVEHIWSVLFEQQADRHSLLINLGGGMVCDTGGFAAACFKRGISFVNIPTTLLSMVDASVGGKTGVNFKAAKNQIGCFSKAEEVILDSYYLRTLNEKELKNGFAEMIKHCLIKDAVSFRKLKFDAIDEASINHSIKIKYNIVSEDYKEIGLRKILNFGHTFGHALETWALSYKKEISHGYAVAFGMIAESYLSHTQSKLSEVELEEIVAYIKSLYTWELTEFPKNEELIALMQTDKKNKLGRINFSLLERVGSCSFDCFVEPDAIVKACDYTWNQLA